MSFKAFTATLLVFVITLWSLVRLDVLSETGRRLSTIILPRTALSLRDLLEVSAMLSCFILGFLLAWAVLGREEGGPEATGGL